MWISQMLLRRRQLLPASPYPNARWAVWQVANADVEFDREHDPEVCFCSAEEIEIVMENGVARFCIPHGAVCDDPDGYYTFGQKTADAVSGDVLYRWVAQGDGCYRVYHTELRGKEVLCGDVGDYPDRGIVLYHAYRRF